eukprot:TRINITY_DN23703_c0_g2_i1.p1 TRINITY_DN23703_c0_g2~~TRINITY_DN23703_c0_g2_i1.p1  ORF type:complete len:538 (-),score=53.22 TRINITY_DN23703_c0_g2_i1:560-2131(-)
MMRSMHFRSVCLPLCFILSYARERMNPFRPFTVSGLFFRDKGWMTAYVSWNRSLDGKWYLNHRMPVDENSLPADLTEEQFDVVKDRLETAYPVHRTIDLDFFRAKMQRWRRGWVRSKRCGNLEPYWDDFNLSVALQDAYGALLSSMLPRSNVLVNIGAGDGPGAGQSRDPVWDLSLSFDMQSVFVEPGPTTFAELERNIREQREPKGLQSEAYRLALTPSQIPNLVQDSAILQRSRLLDILKVDIDVNDCDVAATFLRQRKARIVLIEVNPSFPPPILFCQHASAPPHPNTKPLHGCSLSYMVELFASFDMWLYRYDGQDALFVDRSMAQLLNNVFGDSFPKNEMDCFQWPQLLPSTASAPVDEFRSWFYDIDVEDQLERASRAAMAQYARERHLCPVAPDAECAWEESLGGDFSGPWYKQIQVASLSECKEVCCNDGVCQAVKFSSTMQSGTCRLHKQASSYDPLALVEGNFVVHIRKERKDEVSCLAAFRTLQPRLPMTIGLPACGHSCQFPSHIAPLRKR